MSPKVVVRVGQFSCMRFLERLLFAIVQALLTGYVVGRMR